MSVAGKEYDARGGRYAFAGHRRVGQVEVFVFTKGRFHQRAEGPDEHILLLLQGADAAGCRNQALRRT